MSVASRALLMLGALLVSSGGHAMAIEQPSFQVVQKFDDFEIREYAPQVVAETEVSGTRESAGNSGFRLLAGYIFGKNRGERKIAMTAPVTQTEGKKIAMTAPVTQAASGEDGARWRIQFMMPAEYSLETLPEPLVRRRTTDLRSARRERRRKRSHRFGCTHRERIRASDARSGSWCRDPVRHGSAPGCARTERDWVRSGRERARAG